jgi:CRISPR-associated helicase Cas3/CRISPR-associated endonuclease Cas3-HD
MKCIAHVKKNDENFWILHNLEDHLLKVGKLAGEFAKKFNFCEIGKIIGLWHDLGKYKPEFQERIRIKSGYDEEIHLEGKKAQSVKHAITGAIHSMKTYPKEGCLLAFPIAGHHTGLKDLEDLKHSLRDPFELEAYERILSEVPQDIADLTNPFQEIANRFKGMDATLLIRMLFSCLIDADRLDTESFMSPEISVQRKNSKISNLQDLSRKLESYLKNLQLITKPSPVNTIRQAVLHAVNSKSSLHPGFYSLTVPTGGGKTLSSLSFALKHAVKHEKSRVIYAIPYTSIIEQNAKVFKSIFGEESVFEHHSSIEIEDSQANPMNRLLSENWDHPLIVTTNVQLFESLFSSKTSKTRKIHNVVNSVIILDEAQMIPPEFLQPILNCLKQLVENYKVTVVFCTATQPAFKSHKTLSFNFSGIEEITELAPDPEKLHKQLKRVRIEYTGNDPLDWEALANKINEHKSALIIVNRKDDAFEIYQSMGGNKFHLSTNMCPQHRIDTLEEIKKYLLRDDSVYLVSTQLIEAGVDLDFPVVFRAMSGLDSIAQASGRCNREGRRSELGKVFVFETVRKSPRGHLLQAETIGRKCLQNLSDPLHPDSFKNYFEELFWIKGNKGLDSKNIESLKNNLQFESISNAFRLIPEDTVSILVPYGKGKEFIQILKKFSYIEPNFLKKIQRYTINVRKEFYNELLRDRVVVEGFECLAYLDIDSYYSSEFGFRLDSVDTIL